MLVTRVVLGAGVVNVRGSKTLRTSGLCKWAPSILNMASTQEMRFKRDQESTLDNLQLKPKTFKHKPLQTKFQSQSQFTNQT